MGLKGLSMLNTPVCRYLALLVLSLTLAMGPTAATHAPQLVVTRGGTPAGTLRIGAYYYPWYGANGRHWRDGYLRRKLTTPQQPVLGEYDSRNPQTIARHFQWAQQYGINTFITSWSGAGSYEDGAVHDRLLTSSAIGSTTVAIFYESLALLPRSNGLMDFNDGRTSRKLVSDVDYLSRRYFANPHYQRVGGRPVLYFYVTRTWHGNYARAIANLRSTIKQRYGYDLFLVGDEVDPDSDVTPERIRLFDAITPYTMYSGVQRPGWPDDTRWLANVRQRYDAYKRVADQYGVAFIPNATPGFNDRGVRLGANHYALPREVNRTSRAGTDTLFTRMLDLDVAYLDPKLRAVNVTSFNEWHEDTQLEPVGPAVASSTPTSYTRGYTYPADGSRLLELLRAWRARNGG
jgi:glycoprotein endo-alpha-1,2-mannosidase